MALTQCNESRSKQSLLRSKLAMWMLMALLALMPLLAHGDDEEAKPDARLQGYPIQVASQSGSGLTYLFFVVLTLITAGVLFMNAKRSHLD